jgi:hypothetical protein
MDSRMNLTETDPGAAKAIFNLEKYVAQTGIPPLQLLVIISKTKLSARTAKVKRQKDLNSPGKNKFIFITKPNINSVKNRKLTSKPSEKRRS